MLTLFLKGLEIVVHLHNRPSGKGWAAFAVEDRAPHRHSALLLVSRQAAPIADDLRDAGGGVLTAVSPGNLGKVGGLFLLIACERTISFAIKAMAAGAVIVEKFLPGDGERVTARVLRRCAVPEKERKSCHCKPESKVLHAFPPFQEMPLS